MRRPPFAEQRILSIADGFVRFRYKDKQTASGLQVLDPPLPATGRPMLLTSSAPRILFLIFLLIKAVNSVVEKFREK